MLDSSFLLKERKAQGRDRYKRYRKDGACKEENTQIQMEKQGLAARLFFISFFMKLNVVSGLEKV